MGTVSRLPTVAGRRSEPDAGRIVFKRFLLALSCVLTSPLIFLTWVEFRISGRGCKRVFDASKECLALAPGLLGQYLRTAFYWSCCRDVSPDAAFNIGSLVSTRDTSIGAGTVVGAYSIIGHSVIGRDVLIASRASIVGDPHLHERGRPDGAIPEPPQIGDGCWIGENAIVMANLGARCTVAAGSVVVRPAKPGSTLMGNPARKVNL
jgi:hypothetical protein